MNPILKRLMTALAVKEAVERVREMRAPKPSLWQRLKPLLFLATAGAAAFYVVRSGRVDALLGKERSYGYSDSDYSAPATPSHTLGAEKDA